jgi:hypothetical protein
MANFIESDFSEIKCFQNIQEQTFFKVKPQKYCQWSLLFCLLMEVQVQEYILIYNSQKNNFQKILKLVSCI